MQFGDARSAPVGVTHFAFCTSPLELHQSHDEFTTWDLQFVLK
jgi:hypothetical protein